MKLREPAGRIWPLACLLAYGGAFAFTAFGRDLPAYDDHPGQFFRLWHALERSMAGGHWTADWNPDWWGGYPELQFYPPGFAMAGAAIRLLALGQLSVEAVYQVLCGVVLLLPALAVYLLVSRVLGDGWLALPPAFLALTLSAGLRGGVEEAVRWGILTPRLSLGLLPLLVLSLRSWIETGRAPVWAPVAVAGILLAHPAHGPLAAGVLVVGTVLALVLRPQRRTLVDALVVCTLAGGIVAFWLLPLVVRRAWLIPLAWGDDGLAGFLTGARTRPVLLGIAACSILAWGAVLARRRPFDALLAALPLGVLGVVWLDGLLFRRGWSPVEPDRLVDGLVLSALLAAGLGGGALVAGLTRHRAHPLVRPALAMAAIVVIAVLPEPARGESTLTLWPTARARLWPGLASVSAAHRLPDLWAALRGGSDRVLFLASALRLGSDTAWYAPHSHVLSLAPLLAGREIVHGTYTHPSPLAARFYAGTTAVPSRIDALAERLDGQRVLGQALDRLSPEAFDAFARRLRIATVVVPSADAERARFLRERYVLRQTAAGFSVFDRRDHPWPQVERITYRRYRVFVSPTGGVWVPTGIAAYPLWQAKSRQGTLETRVDAWGLLEFRVPLDLWEAELVYAEGALEWGALALTLAALVAWGVWGWRSRARGPTGRPATGRSPIDRRRRR